MCVRNGEDKMTAKRFWLVPLDYYGEQRFVRDNNQIGEKSLSNEEVVECLNHLHEENIRLQSELDKDILFSPSRHSKTVRMDFLERYTELVNYETKVKETLQGHYDFAKNKKSNCELNDLVCFHTYRVLKATIKEITDEMGVDLE